MSDQALQPPLVATARPTRRRRISAGLVVRYAALVGTLILTIFPLAWLVITSLRYSPEIFATPVHVIPESVTFSQYVAVFSQYGLANYLWNTIIVSLATVVTVTLLSVPCAYAIARFRLPGQKLVVSLFLIMRMSSAELLALGSACSPRGSSSMQSPSKQPILSELTDAQFLALKYDWPAFWGRPDQQVPPGDWFVWMKSLLTGRGWGKTRTATENISRMSPRPEPADCSAGSSAGAHELRRRHRLRHAPVFPRGPIGIHERWPASSTTLAIIPASRP